MPALPCLAPGAEAPRAWSAAGLAGLFAGAAVATKWTNAGTAAAILACVALALERRRGGRTRPDAQAGAAGEADSVGGNGAASRATLLRALAFAGGAAIPIAPWSAWLFARSGNPLAPFAASLFPTDSWSPEQLRFLLETHGPLSPFAGAYWANLYGRLVSLRGGPPLVALVVALAAIAPIAALVRNVATRGSGLRPDVGSKSRPTTEAGVGDAARPSDLFPPPRVPSPLRIAAGIVAGSVVGWLLWGRLRFAQDRFLAPLVAAQIVALGGALGAFVARFGNPARASAAFARPLAPLLALLVALGVSLPCAAPWARAYLAPPYLAFAFGRIDEREFFRRTIGATPDLFRAANELPAGSRVVAFGEARGHYLRGDVDLATVFDLSPARPAILEATDPDDLRSRLIDEGYTHVLVNEIELARLLDFHPPPPLARDPLYARLRAAGRDGYSDLARRYPHFVGFGPEGLPNREAALLREFLLAARERATWPPGGPPPGAWFWIAPLAAAPTPPTPARP